ncbi:hypothetical protein PpBr36_06873 [Pyricularia pennisetigena]|uniref:hypothetical protein n=1 Tax=Pyricularia pennisetigena TaxID=1578925 RepID=UPI00114F94DD|nr:hypothetical protein PpBr36_06873 [Pyricularia pennisetigena]TLS25518.1 hypothetical protein PpBr36_06873 [Pyricularia pennisetigena]
MVPSLAAVWKRHLTLNTDADGLPYVQYCLVSFGGQTWDLDSVKLYLNALGFGRDGSSYPFVEIKPEALDSRVFPVLESVQVSLGPC